MLDYSRGSLLCSAVERRSGRKSGKRDHPARWASGAGWSLLLTNNDRACRILTQTRSLCELEGMLRTLIYHTSDELAVM